MPCDVRERAIEPIGHAHREDEVEVLGIPVGVGGGLDGARAGKTIDEVSKEARTALTKDDVMEGVADLIPMVQVEAVFTDGSRLVTVHSPIQ